MKKLIFLSLIAVLAGSACQKTAEVVAPKVPPPVADPGIPITCNENCAEGVYAYHLNGRLYLYGGDDPSWDFDITDWLLELPQVNGYGYDRESIKALTQPVYQAIQEEAERFDADEPVIYLHTEAGVKVFPYSLISYHEVVNDVAYGHPVMIAYCYLADLAAVYSREYCGQTLTFALSGYTYSAPDIWKGRNGFVLWDRDTESLWWPLIDRAVSGPMQGASLKTFNTQKWGLSTWGEMLEEYPDGLVLKQGQDPNPPTDWPVLEEGDLDCN